VSIDRRRLGETRRQPPYPLDRWSWCRSDPVPLSIVKQVRTLRAAILNGETKQVADIASFLPAPLATATAPPSARALTRKTVDDAGAAHRLLVTMNGLG
jgi:hypothetical protein